MNLKLIKPTSVCEHIPSSKLAKILFDHWVKRVFIKFNAPEASSARSERLFSGGKLSFETKRNRLGDANFEKLLLLSVNKDL